MGTTAHGSHVLALVHPLSIGCLHYFECGIFGNALHLQRCGCGVWLIAGVMMGFGARIFFGSPYFSPGIVGWMCLLVAVVTLPTRESMPASTQTSNGMDCAGQLSKPFYLASLITCFAASIILALLIFAALAFGSHGDKEVAIVFAVLLFIPMVYSTVVMAVLIHRMWSSI